MRKLAPAIVGLSLVAAACGPGDVQVSRVEPEGFIFQIVDASADAGAGLAMAGDADGNPHLTYFVLEEPPVEGEPPPGLQIGVPLRPTVMHAHFVGDAWTRGPLAEEAQVTADRDETAIHIDADGVHHVAWTEGDVIFYTSNAGGSFGEPQRVYSGAVTGISIAAGEDGTPAIAFYDELNDAEGPAALVRAAYRIDEEWIIETAAEADPQVPMTTGIGLTGDEALVAYGSAGETMLARRELAGRELWASETVDEDGGLGVSMALDADGNPHLAYYAPGGAVKHAHSVGLPTWEITPVSDPGGAPEEDWVTAIDLSDDGVHHVVWQESGGIGYATNAEGSFVVEEIGDVEDAVRPHVVAGPEGAVHVAWYDEQDLELVMASMGIDEPLLAVPPPETTAPGPQPGPTGGPPPCEPEGAELQIAAPPGAAASGFDKDCLAAPAGEAFTIEFDNQDEGVPHNVAIYDTSEAANTFFQGETFPGPDVVTYEPDPIADAGQYFFRCDVHPTTMTGTFVVA